MRIGVTYDLKVAASPDQPDDFQEEFDSPHTIEAIASVLRDLGHTVEKLGDGRELLQRLLADPPDFVFNFAEGHGISRSREARVPAVLEMLGIPYTGSDPLTLAVTLDKYCAKQIVWAANLPVPWGFVIDLHAELSGYNSYLEKAPYPLLAKPAWEGSSKGIRSKCVIERPADLPDVVEPLRRDYRQPVLIEEFIEGDELTVGVIGNNRLRVIGAMQVVPRQPTNRFIYGLEVKRDFETLVRYESAPPLATGIVSDAAIGVYRALGCRDVARVDFRLRNGVPYFLEVNPLPGLNPETSDLVILARLNGWTYSQLIATILQAAIDRQVKV